MSVNYAAVGWSRQKKIYDLVIICVVALIVAVFSMVSVVVHPNITAETVLIRATALSAFILLHLILAIGPISRIDSRFLPLLYNRRHLGIAMFALSLIHAFLSVFQFHALGDVPARISFLTAYLRDYLFWQNGTSLSQIPFEPFGFMALTILTLMALTSHDFWLKNLGARLWKKLHIWVYLAYGLIMMHVFYGFLQSERHLFYVVLFGFGLTALSSLHFLAWWNSRVLVANVPFQDSDNYFFVAELSSLAEGCGQVVSVAGKKMALYLDQNQVFAVSNICKHQGGPIGEGKIIDGCITCPWHGWQYKSDTGASPPPFREVLETYPVKIVGSSIYVSTKANPLHEFKESHHAEA